MNLEDVEGWGAINKNILTGVETLDLSQLLSSGEDLTNDERRTVIDTALFLLEDVYVHLPLKRAMHAIDPVQALKLLRRRVDSLSDRQFHNGMIDIFKRLRDLHTNYILPYKYKNNVVFLPFLMEEYYDDEGYRRYIVTRLLAGFTHDRFQPGVEVTRWSGAPIDIAISERADQEAGSNDPARHVRGLDGMTIRPLVSDLPPSEEWVIIGYVDAAGQEREIRLPWQLFSPTGVQDIIARGTSDGVAATMQGEDMIRALINRVRADLFVEDISIKRAQAEELYTKGTGGDAKLSALLGATSFFPDTFEFRTEVIDGQDVGYLRIRSFAAPETPEFVEEVVRILGLLPQDRLIIDVRNNGGGIITSGERLLQLFIDKKVEAERLHFVCNETTLAMSRSTAFDSFAAQFEKSIDLSTVTGAIFSQGFPIEPAENTNAIGRVYPGNVILVTDARCYSTTDIFAAGFQDNGIGKIMGVDGNTGAGGANVFTYNVVNRVMTGAGQPLAPLPKGVDMRVSVRRTTRVGANSGVPVEDLGVVPDEQHRTTLDDLMHRNRDMIAAAAALLD